ncbi:MAG: DegT/DnrJ/EryC1/StrS family aminotransferase [Candidatus Hydrogenedentes bacterium]|nr:DegT/DnrJ/EryC1/StrS family aminotransferase [Candidatus Hydrogenedentota bacterium]
MNENLHALLEGKPADLFGMLPPNRVGLADRAYLEEVLQAGFRNTIDPANILQRLESAFAARFGVRYAILHNSGTGTMQSCLLGAGVGPGDEVIVPPLTAVSTAIVVVQCGAVPVFVDIDPRTYNLDPADVARKITPHTRAIIPVSLYGLPPDYDGLMALAEKHGLTVIEDNAECYLSTYKGRMVGAIGHAASFSFQASKHMTSGGDGGVVITDDREFARAIRKRGALGYSTLGAAPGDVFVPRDVRQDYAFERHDILGYNYRMSAVQAALALGQLERLDALVAARIFIAQQYERVIREEDCDWLVTPYVPAGSTHTYWTYVCQLDEERAGVDWREFRRIFIENGGDGLYSAWRPVHLEPVFRNLAFYARPDQAPNFDPRYQGAVKSYQAGDCPVCEALQPRLCQFKTSMQTLERVEQQVGALRNTIRRISGR